MHTCTIFLHSGGDDPGSRHETRFYIPKEEKKARAWNSSKQDGTLMLTLHQRYYPYQPTTRLISTHRDRPDISVSSCGPVLAASRRTRRHAAIPSWKLIPMNLDFALPFKMTGRVLILPYLIQFASLDTPIGNPEADVLPSEQERERWWGSIVSNIQSPHSAGLAAL